MQAAGDSLGNREWSKWIWEFRVTGYPSRKEGEKVIPGDARPEHTLMEAMGRPQGLF